MYINVYIYLFMSMYMCVYSYRYVYMYTHTHIYIYIYIFIYIYIDIYISFFHDELHAGTCSMKRSGRGEKPTEQIWLEDEQALKQTVDAERWCTKTVVIEGG